MKQVEYYKNGNRTLRIKYEGIKKLLEKKDKEIERLKTELQDTKDHLGEYLHEQEEENKKSTNIIKQLEKYLEDRYYGRGKYHMDSNVVAIKEVFDKIQELKKEME